MTTTIPPIYLFIYFLNSSHLEKNGQSEEFIIY